MIPDPSVQFAPNLHMNFLLIHALLMATGEVVFLQRSDPLGKFSAGTTFPLNSANPLWPYLLPCKWLCFYMWVWWAPWFLLSAYFLLWWFWGRYPSPREGLGTGKKNECEACQGSVIRLFLFKNTYLIIKGLLIYHNKFATYEQDIKGHLPSIHK